MCGLARRGQAGPMSGYYVSGLEDIRTILTTNLSDGSELVVSDMSLGSRRPHDAAQQMCEQLGIKIGADQGEPTQMLEFPTEGSAQLIGQWIDAETRGDRLALNNLAFATSICQFIGQGHGVLYAVILPRFGFVWSRADEMFIEVISDAFAVTDKRVLIFNVGRSPYPVPSNWPIEWVSSSVQVQTQVPSRPYHLVPGIISDEYINKIPPDCLAGFWRFRKNAFLVPPEMRRPTFETCCEDFDNLAELFNQPWLKAYAKSFGTKSVTNVATLLCEGFRQVATGGEESGLYLFRAASRCAATLVERATIEALAQGLKIAMLRFQEAAEAEEPSGELPEPLRGILHQHKGWALVMVGDTAGGLKHLSVAVNLLIPTFAGQREALYLLNIFALAWLRAGVPETALRLETLINAALRDQHSDDYQLRYVNSLNLARLHRELGNLAISRQMYEDAFATSLGVRSNSDLIYMNACLARLDSQGGSQYASLLGWLRVVLHWLSSPAPEALAKRAIRMLLGGYPESSESLVNVLATALMGHLAEAIRRSPMAPLSGNLTSLTPSFVSSTTLESARRLKNVRLGAVGTPGWGLLTCDERLPSAVESLGISQLARMTFSLLCSLSPSSELRAAQTLVVDDQFGTDVPVNRRELARMAVRFDAETLEFGRFRIQLNPSRKDEVERHSQVALSSAVKVVSRLSGDWRVLFKRLREPVSLDASEKTIVSSVSTPAALFDLISALEEGELEREVILQRLRKLEKDRILTVVVSAALDDYWDSMENDV